MVLFFRQKKQKRAGIHHMTMIAQNNNDIQAVMEKVLAEIPIALGASGGAIYILIKDLPEETTKFIQGEEFAGIELPVLPEEYEKLLVAAWRSRGFKSTYCRQGMEYMNRNVIIRYLHVKNPESGVNIFLLPWFMLPRKKYPVQVYAYAAWHNAIADGPAGVIETSEAVKELFGLETFDPSTVCRSKAQISSIFQEQGENNAALSNQEPKIASTKTIIDWVTETLDKQPATESIKYDEGIEVEVIEQQPKTGTEEGGGQTNEAQSCGPQVIDSGNNESNEEIAPRERADRRAGEDSVIARVLGNIPWKLGKVIKPKPRVKHERRERAPRERGERLRAEHKEINFVETDELERIRNEFTMNCKNIVLNTALTYHKLLS